jgi:hypothetical protein
MSEALEKLARRERLASAILLLAFGGLACAAIAQIALRVVFPWDYYVWSESPFLTNLWKMSKGMPVFGDPADANSWPYSPSLEWICYILLRPFGLELDVRWSRVVTIAAGALGAVFVACVARTVAGPRRARAAVFLCFLAALLLGHRSFTFDICHPDNLHIAHFGAVFWLCLAARERRSFALSLAAAALAGAGVLAKQTAAPIVSGAILAVGEPWWRGERSSLGPNGIVASRGRALAVAAAGLGALAVSVALLFAPKWGRFYTFELLSSQPLDLSKLRGIIFDIQQYPQYALLALAAPFCAGRALASSDPRFRNLAFTWLALSPGALGGLLGYFKAMGTWNNLGVTAYWIALLVFPVLWVSLPRPGERNNSPARAALVYGTQILFLITLMPIKFPPNAAQRDWCESLESHIRADVQAGRRVLLPHGTAVLLRAGVQEIPKDRMASCLDLGVSGRGALAATRARIESKQYDRIYWVAGWYGPEITELVEANYKIVATLPSDGDDPGTSMLCLGYHGYTRQPVRVWEPKR